MGAERVAKLFRHHRFRIARALVRHVRALAPRYEQLDRLAQERSYVALLVAVERILESGDDSLLVEQTEHNAAVRAMLGFQMEDFLLASLAWLPVVRQFLVEQSATAEEALADYAAFESIALPLVARAASTFLEADEEPTLPNLKRPASLRRRPLAVERVRYDSGDDDENEPTDRSFTPFVTSSAESLG